MPLVSSKIVILLSLSFLGCISLGCHRAETAPAAAKPPEVFVALPVTREVVEQEEFTGQLVAPETIEVRARVSGYLQKVFFQDGQLVEKGAPLFEIDPRPYQLEVNRAAAALSQARAHLERLKRQEERARDLLKKGATSQEQFDAVSFDRAESAAAVSAAAANQASAELNLEFTRISAKVAGRIGRRLVDPGNLVRADETPLTSIVSVDPLYAYFDIDELTVLRLQRLLQAGTISTGLEAKVPVKIGLADEVSRFSLEGVINFIDNQVERSTGTLRARAVVANPKRMLSPGMFVRLQVPIGAPRKSLLVKEEALGTDQGQQFLYVLDSQNKVVYRRVKTGSLQEGLRVIEEGITPQDKVIVTGLQRVRPGISVDPKPASAAPQLHSAGKTESAPPAKEASSKNKAD